MRKGFLYTVLAVFMLNLVILAVVVPLDLDAGGGASDRVNVDEMFYFTSSVQDDVRRSVDISSRRAMVAVTNLVVNSGEPVTDPESIIGEAFLNGTIEGNVSDLMDESSFRDWIGKMEAEAAGEGYSINMSVELADLEVDMEEPFVMSFDFLYDLSIRDPDIGVGFNRTDEVFHGRGTIDGVDDPLIVLETAGKRFQGFSRCPAPEPASVAMTGTESEYNYTDDGAERTWAGGDAAVYNGSDASTIDDRPSTVLVTDDLCTYDPAVLDEFAGVVSEATTDGQDVCGSGDEIDGYIGGINDHTAVADGHDVVMNQEDVWVNNIPDRIASRCFFPDDDGPSFLDRLAGEYQGTGNGLASFLDVPNLPPEVQQENVSAVDHVYFDDSTDYGPVHRIKGVSEDEEWFRLDDDHVDAWDLGDLTY